MNITITRTVELTTPILPEVLPAPLYEGESNAHTFIISATKNKEAQPLSGSVVAFFDRPDGTSVRINGQVKDEKAYVTLTHECYAMSGAFFLRVMLLNGETQVVIYSASGRMRKKADGESIDGGSTPGGGIVPPGGGEGFLTITINGQPPDENGNFVLNVLNDVEVAQLNAAIT